MRTCQRLCGRMSLMILLLFSRMTLDKLEHRNIAEINRVFEWLVSLVAGFAFCDQPGRRGRPGVERIES